MRVTVAVACLALTGCGASHSQATTTIATAPTTTILPTTTTALPVTNALTAANDLVNARIANDRNAALGVATPDAVKAFFNSGTPTGWRSEGCDAGLSGQTGCSFYYAGGGGTMVLQKRSDGGYMVVEVDVAPRQ